MDRNSPQQVACPHCSNSDATIYPPIDDWDDYRCPDCGDFRITGTERHRFDAGYADPKKARFVETVDGRRLLTPD
jgi:DNA-directed RNA polymerase subunit RPC12/RpoP